MAVEIERKFLVDNEGWNKVDKPEGVNFIQGYILSDDQRTIRIRLSEKEAVLNLKGPSTGYSRPEFEYRIPLKDGKEILQKFSKNKVEKTRYCVDHDGKNWEVDVFSGENEGLITAELELEKEDEQFSLPPWVIKEVSDDHRFANSSLAKLPFKKWRS